MSVAGSSSMPSQEALSASPSPGTPGEGWGEGSLELVSASNRTLARKTLTLPSPGVPGEGKRAQAIPRRRGFTLIEVLATVMLLAIIVPAINKGISVATGMASSARMRTEATGLAESKLNELLATGEWQNGQSAGDFSPDWPQYHWQSTVTAWQYDTTSVGLQQIDVTVTYTYRNVEKSITISSLTYVRADNSSTGTGTGTSTP